MGLQPPSEDELKSLGADLYLDLSEEEVIDYKALITEFLDSYETITNYEDETLASPSDRNGGHRVQDDDPYNAWITRCAISERDDGRLAGWNVAIKDNIAVGGVEMTCGSKVVEGYVPDADATLVSRLLSEGATMVGKTNLDDMAFSGNGHSSAFGPTLNPHDDDYLSGGSSGGSAIVVATEEVDIAIGSDQGGSIRVPASWSGVVGHKPTHGLVPYTGCVGIDNTIDHPGPLGRNVRTVAETLTVIAGQDPRDPRQSKEVPTQDYASALDGDVDELTIGVVEEGFNRSESDPEVNERVRSALDNLEDQGANIRDISLPIHADAADIYTVSLAEGFLAAVHGEGLDHHPKSAPQTVRPRTGDETDGRSDRLRPRAEETRAPLRRGVPAADRRAC